MSSLTLAQDVFALALCSLQKGCPPFGAGSQSHVPLWLLCGEDLAPASPRLTICSPILVLLQPVGQAAGAAGPPQCPVLPHPQPAAPLRDSPLPSAACRCSCTCVACRTAPVTCAASCSNCGSSRYRPPLGPLPVPRPLKPGPTRTHLLALKLLPKSPAPFPNRSSESAAYTVHL